jgi:TonB family protein
MTRYALYFDHAPRNVERRNKRIVAATVIALHLFLFMWALRTHPQIVSTATSLVVIELNGLSNVVFADHVKHDISPKKVVSKPASSQAKPVDRHTHDQTPAGGIDRTAVAEGKDVAGNSDESSQSTGALAANATGVAYSTLTSNIPGGRGSIYGRFHPPQVIHRARLTYPRAAIQAEQQGDVDVLVTISAQGNLLAASVDKSSGSSALDQASLDSIRLYQFKAAEKDGSPVQAQAVVTVEWKIGRRERYEFANYATLNNINIDLDAQIKSVGFLGSVPSRRQPCEHMKNPDCLASPTGD